MPALNAETPVARALRALQKLDEAIETVSYRYLLIEAESLLGEVLGLECTGEPGGWNADGSVACYDHNGGTCPIHEWLDEADAHEIGEALRRQEGGRR